MLHEIPVSLELELVRAILFTKKGLCTVPFVFEHKNRADVERFSISILKIPHEILRWEMLLSDMTGSKGEA